MNNLKLNRFQSKLKEIFGLNNYEIMVIIELLKEKTKSNFIKDLYCSIPYSRMYDISYSLYRKGLVTIQLKTPSWHHDKYVRYIYIKLNDWDTIIKNIEQKENEKIKEIQDRLNKFKDYVNKIKEREKRKQK